MTIDSLTALRATIRSNLRAPEATLLPQLLAQTALTPADRARITASAADLVRAIRAKTSPGMMEVFLAEYGLSTDEGIALMCLAEALLRVPDADTIDALIEDKIAPSNWGQHLGKSASSLVNASTWALMLTGKVLDDEKPGIAGALRGLVKRVGEPLIRTAVARAMREMGRNFVLGRTIAEAMDRAKKRESKGFTYSYDMLGEAAMTEADAKRYHLSYSEAISAIAKGATYGSVATNPGISVKLSALFPRYEHAKASRVMTELVPRVRALALLAKSAGIGFNIDAEESARLDLSLDVIEAVLSDKSLAGWDGFGVVVQAYGRRAAAVLDWLYALAKTHNRRIMVRLAKGAYWDTEIKLAQVNGLPDFPIFTRKAATDVSYIANARKLLDMRSHIYPQFATHNAHTVAAILDMAGDATDYEFQRLHGMGESLHDIVMDRAKTHCRIYAPVGAHRDLLAYLVRRLLENGANSSFVNQIVDEDVAPEEVAADPLAAVEATLNNPTNPGTTLPAQIFKPRRNSMGFDLTDTVTLDALFTARDAYSDTQFAAAPMLAKPANPQPAKPVINPANAADQVGTLAEASADDTESALAAATPWDASPADRAAALRRAADAYEADHAALFAILAREAGKTLADSLSELREAVDFLRYYADQAETLTAPARGTIACISPWNFPLAIFTGQIAAALAAGNAVIAKPAETTGLVAARAIAHLHGAGVPISALQLLPGAGGVVGAAITSDPRIAGACFTGSTATAQRINRAMAANLAPSAPLIAETGGLNAMIVDSTALPEQAVRDIVASAFQSSGQRCSALRVLYVQEDIADTITHMLFGAMDELEMGDPWHLATDIGPVIDDVAQSKIQAHVDAASTEGRLLRQSVAPALGHFVAPAVIRVNGINDLAEEIFGPVLHIARFKSRDLNKIIADINATGYGLTFGLHTRIDDRVEQVISALKVGNAYVNRNQIGAVVGSQPFGGEGLSGTGPKAGGPSYVPRFVAADTPEMDDDGLTTSNDLIKAIAAARKQVQATPLAEHNLPGPTGESNRLSDVPRGVVLCLGPTMATAEAQAAEARAQGCGAVVAGAIAADQLATLQGFDAAIFWGQASQARAYRIALASRQGMLIPLISERGQAERYRLERHVCIDTTASGGNAQLLAASGDA